MEVVTLTDTEWQACLDRLPAYSFLATPAWSRILADGLGYRSQALLYRFRDVEFLLPIAARRNRIGELVWRSMPFGLYGGPLTISADNTADMARYGAAIATDLRRRLGFGYLVAYPGPYPHVALPRIYERTITHLLDLNPGLDAVWNGVSPATRRKIRQAERASVSVEIDHSRAAFLAYYEMLEASAKRWGRRRPDQPWGLFEALCQQAGPECAALWLATVSGQLAAGVVIVYGKGEAFYLSGAMHKELAHSRPNDLLHWRVIEDATARGHYLYNMGAGAHLTGVRRFKEAFGAAPVEYPSYIVAGPLNQLIRRLRGWRE